MIKPASNNQVREWRKLLMGKYRKRNGLFLAEGTRCVEQIIKNQKVELDAILKGSSINLNAFENTTYAPVFELSSDDFSSISDTESPQGILAVCKIPSDKNIDEIAEKPGLILALDAVQDPGNMGTIIRTAAWFGVSALLFGAGSADPFQPKVVRSTAGATGVIDYIKGDLSDCFDTLEKKGWTINLLDGSSRAHSLDAITPLEKEVLVVGNEGNGIDKNLIKANRNLIRIDGNQEIVESLNAAVATSIALYSFAGRM